MFLSFSCPIPDVSPSDIWISHDRVIFTAMNFDNLQPTDTMPPQRLFATHSVAQLSPLQDTNITQRYLSCWSSGQLNHSVLPLAQVSPDSFETARRGISSSGSVTGHTSILGKYLAMVSSLKQGPIPIPRYTHQ